MTPVSSAGWATAIITPPLGLPMGGRGARFSPGEEVLDDLLAQAMVLRDAQGRQLVLISVDLIELSSPYTDQIAYNVAALLDLPTEHVIVNASHTHSGPMMGIHRYATNRSSPPELQAYMDGLVPTITKLVYQASQRMTPVKVTWHDGHSTIGINRRLLVDGQIHLAPNPDGVYDDSLWVLDVQALDDPNQRAVLFAHACHPVMIYGFKWSAFSAEWPGQARLAIQKKLGSSVHAQFFQGLAGNIRPRILGDLATGKFRNATWEDVVAVGQTMAADVVSALAGSGDALTLQLAATQGWFTARRENQLPPASYWQDMLASSQEIEREAATHWLSRYAPDGLPPFRVAPWPVGVIQLAREHGIAWFGGEPVSEWRAIIQRALPGKKLAAWGYTYDNIGYLATDELLPQGGYEVTYSWLGNQSPAIFQPGLDHAATLAFQQLASRLPT